MKIGFFALLALVFITLKLCAVISWSWAWVTAPLWLPLMSMVSVLLLFGVLTGLCEVALMAIRAWTRGRKATGSKRGAH